MYSTSCTMSISVCDWSNMFIQGTNTGEVTGVYPSQLFWNVDADKHVKCKKFVSIALKNIYPL